MSAVSTIPRPYKGLTPYEDAELDALLFFGREREREIIVANLLASRLTVLYGATGVGKSSLLRAGVARALRALDGTRVAVFNSWSSDPTEEVEVQLTAAGDDDLYLIFDQIEEYFLYHHGADRFAQRLPELVSTPGLRVNVLLGIREDALAKLDFFKGRIPSLFSNYLRLDHLDRAAARAAIRGPLERLNDIWPDAGPFDVEPELVNAVLDQVEIGRIDYGLAGRGVVVGRDEPGRIEAPFLQLVLDRVWEVERAQESRTLRLATLTELGGAERIVRDHLERALSSLTPEQQVLAAEVFEHLVTPSGTKIAHGVGDLAGYARAPRAELEDMLGRLASERIVRPLEDAAGNGRYEIFHDVLADGVLAWRAAFESERELERERGRRRRAISIASAALIALAAVAAIALFALAQRGRAEDRARQARARELAARALVGLNSDPQQSLRLAVRAAADDRTGEIENVLRQSLDAARERLIVPALPTASVVAFDERDRLLVPFDNRLRIYSRTGRIEGELPVAAASLLALSNDGRLALLMRGRKAVVQETATGRIVQELRQPGPVLAAAFDPTKRYVAIAATNAAGRDLARLYRLNDGKLLRLFPERGIKSVAFSPNGKLLATGSADGAARLFSVPTGKPGRTLTSDDSGRVLTLEFSPDSELLATAGADGALRIWDLATGERRYLFIGHNNFIVDVAWSPDGQFVTDASLDRTSRVVDVAGIGGGSLAAALIGHAGPVRALAYSRDGRMVATVSSDGSARLWDARAEEKLELLGRHRGGVPTATFDRRGRLAVSAGADGRIQVWNTTRRRLIRATSSSKSRTFAIFDPSSQQVLFGGGPAPPGLWRFRAGTPRLLGKTGADHGAWTSDGRAVTGGRDGVVRIWTGARAEARRLRLGPAVTALAAGPNGLLAAGGVDGVVKLWRDGGEVTLDGHVGRVNALDFSPDGRLLVTGGDDATARLWDVETATLVAPLRGHTLAVTDVAFSPNGRLVLTTSQDHDVRLWTIDGTLWQVLIGHFATVNTGSFSRDGRWIVTTSSVSAALWRTGADAPFAYLRGHLGPVRTAEFSPDGREVLTASDDGTVRLYECELCGGIDALGALAKRRLTAASTAPRAPPPSGSTR
jgi:WD40 repeat protein